MSARDIFGALADSRRAGLRLVLRLRSDIPVDQTIELARGLTTLDLNGYGIFGGTADPLIRIYNGISVTDVGILSYSEPGNEFNGAVQDVHIKNGQLYTEGESVFEVDGSRVTLSGLIIVGGQRLFDNSTNATRSFSQLSDSIWSPSAADDFSLPAGMRVNNLTITEDHGTITLPANAAISNSKLSGDVTLDGNGAQATGNNLDDGVLDFTVHIVNVRNATGNVLTGATSGANAQTQDEYSGNN
jgi:hypothetical protein